MSIQAMQLVWERSTASGSALVVMLCLADHADDTFTAWPSVATIGRASRMQARGVHKVLAKLVDAGEIIPAGTGPRGVVRYRLTFGDPVHVDRGGEAEPLSARTEVKASTPVRADICPSGHPCPSGQGTPVQVDTPPLSARTDKPLLEPPLNPQSTPPAPPLGMVSGLRKAVVPSATLDPKPPPAPDPVQAMVAEWNDFAADLGLSTVQKMTGPRRAKALARLKDCGGIDGWRTALEKVRAAKWMWDGTARGGWRANFDFLLQESRFVKLMEGGYGEGGGAPEDPLMAAVAGMRGERR